MKPMIVQLKLVRILGNAIITNGVSAARATRGVSVSAAPGNPRMNGTVSTFNIVFTSGRSRARLAQIDRATGSRKRDTGNESVA